jgi:hypothetical protein
MQEDNDDVSESSSSHSSRDEIIQNREKLSNFNRDFDHSDSASDDQNQPQEPVNNENPDNDPNRIC